MPNTYLKGKDVISGQEGVAYANIDGEVKTLFMVKAVEAVFTKRKVEVHTLGKRGTQNKTVGWSGTGTLTMYYVSSIFRQLAVDYIKNGTDLNITLTVVNNDPSSSVGKQTVVLYNVNLNSTILAKLDTEADKMEENAEFTFDDAEILNAFSDPS